MRVREASGADLPAVLALAVAFYREGGFATPAAELRRNLATLHASPSARIAIADTGAGPSAGDDSPTTDHRTPTADHSSATGATDHRTPTADHRGADHHAGHAVGFAVTTTSFGLESGLIAELEDLFVAPAARRAGIAAELVADSVRWARARGCRSLELVIAPHGPDDGRLAAYYHRLGFTDEGRRLLNHPL